MVRALKEVEESSAEGNSRR